MTTNTARADGNEGSADPAVQVYRPAPVEGVPPAASGGAIREVGGRKDGTDPTRFGDWEKHGRCIDF
jgi:hypothetical protein